MVVHVLAVRDIDHSTASGPLDERAAQVQAMLTAGSVTAEPSVQWSVGPRPDDLRVPSGRILHRGGGLSTPSTTWQDVATKQGLRALGADLRTEMAELRTDLRTEMADLRTDLRPVTQPARPLHASSSSGRIGHRRSG